MSNELDDFYSAIENVTIERKIREFKINHIKLEHFYLNENDNYPGTPISTSVELKKTYNYEIDKVEWKKLISHTYSSFENVFENKTDTHEEIVPSSLIERIEKFDLRSLKNNYFTEEESENLTHWEITYNNYFKIVGTYDQNIEEFKEISGIIGLKEAIEKEPLEIIKRLENGGGDNLWS